MSKPSRKRQLWPDVVHFGSELHKKDKKQKFEHFPNSGDFFAIADQKLTKNKSFFNNSFVEPDKIVSSVIESDQSSNASNESLQLRDICEVDSEGDIENQIVEKSRDNITEPKNNDHPYLDQSTSHHQSNVSQPGKSQEDNTDISECHTQWSDLPIPNYEDLDKLQADTEHPSSPLSKASTTTPSKLPLLLQEQTYDSGKKKKIKFIKGGLAEKLHLLLERQKRDKLFKNHKYKIMNVKCKNTKTCETSKKEDNETYNKRIQINASNLNGNGANSCSDNDFNDDDDSVMGLPHQEIRCLVTSNGFESGHMVSYDCEVINYHQLNPNNYLNHNIDSNNNLNTIHSNGMKVFHGSTSDFIDNTDSQSDNNGNLRIKKARLLVTKENNRKHSIAPSTLLNLHPPWFILSMPDNDDPVLLSIDISVK